MDNMLLQLTLLLSFVANLTLATNTAGEPTDIANWPPCAQQCIPQGFGPPANCGSLSNLTCVCRGGTFSGEIAACEILGCSAQERSDIATLSDRLCAPVGGFGPALGSSVSAVFASTQLSISATPSIPPTVTASEAISSVLATATLAPDLGNPADLSSFPRCAQICFNETTANNMGVDDIYGGSLSGDTNNLDVVCGPAVRAATAGCEAITCSASEFQGIALRAQQLCGSLYNSNATLSSSVSAAIASATAEAIAATEGKDPTDLSVYPPCAQQCIPQNNFNGCGSITNRQCICQSIQFQDAINPCETSTCSPADLKTIFYLAEILCEPVGGVQTNPIDYSANNFTNGSSPPVPFTGEATGLQGSFLGYMVGALAVGLGLLLL